ncbi:MAG: Na+/H+ antiporter subunit D, partial [Fimbriimonadaceae bacterium]|nr:Na+/H+ antiporter subunit D [Fimbriimonadaceae bacterium]
NLVSSALFLTALGLLNGSLGTLNMAHLAERVATANDPGFITAVSILFLVAFSIKSALFPLYGWLPASYHTPPAAVSALFAGLLTKVGVYALIRTFTLIFTQDPGFTHQLVLLPLAAMTILAGGMGFWVQHDMRRAFAFAIVASVGVALVGLAMTGIPGSEAARTLALAGALAYVFQTMLVKTQLFLMAGIVRRAMGSCDLRTIGGLAATAPWLAAMAMIGLMAFAGVPPLSGFAPKVAVLRASLDLQQGWVAACILAGSVLALAGVARIWSEAFWKKPLHRPDESEQDQPANALARIVPVTGLALCIVALGLGAGPVFDAAESAARQLLDPSAYIRAVLGGGP